MEGTRGEIRLFAGNFAPKNWSFCNGSILSIQSNTALFSILGTTYGGNGTTNFALPNLQGRIPVGTGQGPGLSNYVLGQVSGVESVALTQGNLPTHTHSMMATSDAATTNVAAGGSLASNPRGGTMPNIYEANALSQTAMASQTGPAGASQPVSVIQPVLALEYIVCMYGVYPSRS